MQGEDHHCQEEQEFWGIPAKTKITSVLMATRERLHSPRSGFARPQDSTRVEMGVLISTIETTAYGV
jgi:hypothetical protein